MFIASIAYINPVCNGSWNVSYNFLNKNCLLTVGTSWLLWALWLQILANFCLAFKTLSLSYLHFIFMNKNILNIKKVISRFRHPICKLFFVIWIKRANAKIVERLPGIVTCANPKKLLECCQQSIIIATDNSGLHPFLLLYIKYFRKNSVSHWKHPLVV